MPKTPNTPQRSAVPKRRPVAHAPAPMPAAKAALALEHPWLHHAATEPGAAAHGAEESTSGCPQFWSSREPITLT